MEQKTSGVSNQPVVSEPVERVEKPAEVVKKPVKIDSIMAVMNVVARILAIRLFLFLSILGSFVLAIIADVNQSLQSIAVVVLFAFVTTLPLTILEWKNHNRG